MKLVKYTLFLALTPVLAMPFSERGANDPRQLAPVCGGGLLYTQAQCCRTDVLGVADLDCKPPRK